MKKILVCLFVGLLILAIVVGGCTAPSQTPTQSPTVPPSPTQTVQVSMAGPTLGGVYYIHAGAISELVRKKYPGINVTVTAIGGSNAVLQAVKDGKSDWAYNIGKTGAYTGYKGVLAFDGKPYPDLRALFSFGQFAGIVFVRADLPINSFKDLNKSKFYPAAPGSALFYMVDAMAKDAGITLDYIPGSYGDAESAISDKRIDGIIYSTSGAVMPASLLSVHLTTPLKVIPLTDREIQAAEKGGGALRIDFPAGSFKEFPKLGAWSTIGDQQVMAVSTRMSQDVAYALTKASCDNWTEYSATLDSAKGIDPISFTLKGLSGYGGAPLHAGAVKYFLEKGAKVPNDLIPPEYKK